MFKGLSSVVPRPMNAQGKDHEAAILVYDLVSAPIGNITGSALHVRLLHACTLLSVTCFKKGTSPMKVPSWN